MKSLLWDEMTTSYQVKAANQQSGNILLILALSLANLILRYNWKAFKYVWLLTKLINLKLT